MTNDLFVLFVGMYAGTHIAAASLIDLNPQIVIPLMDIEHHTTHSKYDNSVLSNYPWQSTTQVCSLFDVYFENAMCVRKCANKIYIVHISNKNTHE